jgi:riboflavin synthase
MFTGLIESVGDVVAVEQVPGAARLFVSSDIGDALSLGESVAVNGVCLTVVQAGGGTAVFDMGPETMRVTTLGELEPGSVVNLERAMRGDARFGGHFVQGHVDAVGTIVDVRPEGEFWWLRVRYPGILGANFVIKGSVAVDGISLTVAALGDDSFDVQIIPFTWTHTNLQSARAGTRVNLECDVIGKYVARAVSLMMPPTTVRT